MFDMIDERSDKDLSLDRTMDLGNNVVHIKKEGPYGFWFISLEKGQLPNQLKGSYTSFLEAEKAVSFYYINEKGRDLKPAVK